MKTNFTPLTISGNFLLSFLLLFLFHETSFAQLSVDYGKSYVNVTKGPGGGTNEPGDILEIRATFVVLNATAHQCSYADKVPAGTTYIPGTLRVLTNEGVIFRQWTDAATDDPGTISGTGIITINLGKGAGAASGGTVKNSDKPSVSGTCIMVASFRVQINPSLVFGDFVDVGTGSINYSNSSAGAINVINFSPDTIVVYKNYGICTNTVGSNTILSEFGGTFGSGKAKDRAPSLKVPANYTYTPFTSNSPDDRFYGVSNNTSPEGGNYNTINTWTIPDPHRVFGTWDVIGDHTNAINPLTGNLPTDTVNGTGGYMIVINASYRTDTAFKDVVTNLCPNTYYQYTAWLRNIGPKGGCDSNGVTAISGSSAYIPTGPGDSSGVHPNLTFNANGYDYYTTGDMAYTGKWIQKGFTFKTGPTQTQMTIYIRNNAPGGGGNDWAIDDISVASCSPNMQLTPAKPDTVCQGADDTVGFKISSFFDSYSYWQIEQSVNGGSIWTPAGTDTTGMASSGSVTPVYNPATGQYEYGIKRFYRISSTVPLVLYRITVASTPGNFGNSNCSFSSTNSKVIHTINCNIVLPVTIASFTGKLLDGLAHLQWVSSDETPGIKYFIERSKDNRQFSSIGSLEGQAAGAGPLHTGTGYRFVDPEPLTGPAWYRIRISDANLEKFSKVVLLSNSDISFGISSLVNPFRDNISFDLTVPDNATIICHVVDAFGRVIKRDQRSVIRGLNSITLSGLANMPPGLYALQIQFAGTQICKPIVKIPL
ncbi:hypothetical protein ACX0G9_15305 [Flavitalea flava]